MKISNIVKEVFCIGYKKRIWYPGACYHVMGRGVRGLSIFNDEMDYELFMMLLRKCKEKYGVILHSYCLMTNHFHLQIQTQDINIGTIMEWLLRTYAVNFNYKYDYKGHLFQGPYKGILIENNNYFLTTSKYIHLNPVKAYLVKRPEDYPYSSFSSYLNEMDDDILEKKLTLSYFLNSKEYVKFVLAGYEKEEMENEIMLAIGEKSGF